MMKIFTSFLIICIVIVWQLSCAVDPVTGKRTFMLLSENDEIKLGQSTDEQIVEMYGLYDSDAINGYINRMGQEMAGLSHRPHLPWKFKVMDTPVINAFAVPGGYVYMTRGILAFLNNEAEVAGVIGHEIGHVAARHSAEQYTKAQFAQLGIGLGAAVSETFAQYAGVAAQGIGILFLKFSRDNEREADNLGVEYSTKAGYDAREMANFFATLERMQVENKGAGLPNWLSTHPNPEDRVNAVRSKAVSLQKLAPQKTYRINRDVYLAQIDGMIYGADPRQGFVENGMFYHPELKFMFAISKGWQVNNLPAQVELSAPEGKAAVILGIAAKMSPQAAAQVFVAKNNAQVLSQTDKEINGYGATKVVSQISGQSGILQLLSYFILKENHIYAFHGITTPELYNGYKSDMEMVMESFSLLKDRSKIDVKPDRIKIIKADQRLSLQALLVKQGVKQENLEKLALLNGRYLNDIMETNAMIKIINYGR
jgi:predicted Zn-dependent protease